MLDFLDYAAPMPDYFDTPDETRLVAHLVVMGDPRAKARPRVTRNGTFTPKGTVDAEARVRAAFETLNLPDYRLDATFRIDVDFYLGTRRHVDLDNLVKLVKDALNGVAYTDDHLVVDERARKWHTTRDRARTELFLYLIPGDREERI